MLGNEKFPPKKSRGKFNLKSMAQILGPGPDSWLDSRTLWAQKGPKSFDASKAVSFLFDYHLALVLRGFFNCFVGNCTF